MKKYTVKVQLNCNGTNTETTIIEQIDLMGYKANIVLCPANHYHIVNPNWNLDGYIITNPVVENLLKLAIQTRFTNEFKLVLLLGLYPDMLNHKRE